MTCIFIERPIAIHAKVGNNKFDAIADKKISALLNKFDVLKICTQNGKAFVCSEMGMNKLFATRRDVREELSRASGGAWIEQKGKRKQYFLDKGWLGSNIQKVDQEEFLRGGSSYISKVTGIALGVLGITPGVLELAANYSPPLPATGQIALGLLAAQQKSPGVAFLSTFAVATSTPTFTEFQINNYTTGGQSLAQVATFNDGNFVVVWQSSGQDGDGWGVFGQLFGNDGVKIGPEFQVNNYTMNGQSTPDVAILTDGSFVVTWSSEGDGDSSGIFAKHFSANGTAITDDLLVNTYTTSYQKDPTITRLSDGRYFIGWVSCCQDGDQEGIFGQLFNVTDKPIGAEFQINNYTTGFQSFADSAPISFFSGGCIVVWQDPLLDGDNYGIVVRAVNGDTGMPVQTEILVNEYTTGTQANPRITSLSSDIFVVVWESCCQDGAGYGIFGRLLGRNLTPSGPEFQVNTFTNGTQVSPAIISFPNGEFFVTWTSANQDNDGDGIFAQHYSSTGSVIGTEFQVNTYEVGDQHRPQGAAFSNGGLILIWESEGQDGSGLGVYGQRYDENKQPIGPGQPMFATPTPTPTLSPLMSLTSPSSNLPPSSRSGSFILPSSTISPPFMPSPTPLNLNSSVQFMGPSSVDLPSTHSQIPSTFVNSHPSSSLESTETTDYFTLGQLPVLTSLYYGVEYPVLIKGQQVGTFTFTGGNGNINPSTQNTIVIELDSDFEANDGDTIELFTLSALEAEGLDIVLAGEFTSCREASDELEENTDGDYTYIISIEEYSCAGSAIKQFPPLLSSVGALN